MYVMIITYDGYVWYGLVVELFRAVSGAVSCESYCSLLLLTATAHSYCSQLLLTATAHSYSSQLQLTATAHSYCSQLPLTTTAHSYCSQLLLTSTATFNKHTIFIKKNLVLIPSESEDTSGSDSECDLPSCDEFSPINVYEEKFVTFYNPLFDSNDDFTFSDDESLSDEDVLEDNVKIYSNPLFKFNDEYIYSDVNPLLNEVLEDIESEDSCISKLDEPDLLVTPLSKLNEDECFDPDDDFDEIELLLHHDPSTSKISVAFILEGFTDEQPLEENDDLFDLKSKENEWKNILYDAPIDDLMTEDKVFDPGISEKISPQHM
ncbi:hypothetical protein Tco_0415441 [Tanacetum coccineum]